MALRADKHRGASAFRWRRGWVEKSGQPEESPRVQAGSSVSPETKLARRRPVPVSETLALGELYNFEPRRSLPLGRSRALRRWRTRSPALRSVLGPKKPAGQAEALPPSALLC